MEKQLILLFSLWLLTLFVFPSFINCNLDSHSSSYDVYSLNRYNFSKDFIFGAASAAYQYEGAAYKDGKGLSIWDTFTHEQPWKVANHSNGDVALDSYHRYREDFQILNTMCMDAYRMSISWTRILPNGSLKGGRNEIGIQHYKTLFHDLALKGKKPFVTIFHWDLPQALEDQYMGFLSRDIVKDYVDYADILFQEFGDKVKYWSTFNEPYMFILGGYINGTMAPGYCSPWMTELNCTRGDSAVEPYLVAHYMLLAHAAVVKLYREKYQEKQGGEIGIAHVADWTVPLSQSAADKEAMERAFDFSFGWFMEPMIHGDYPEVMRRNVGVRLPKFTEEESASLIGSFDFIGLNYYSSKYVFNRNVPAKPSEETYFSDVNVYTTSERNGQKIGIPAPGSAWINVYPRGLRDFLIHVKDKYGNPKIFITENGISEKNDPSIPLSEALNDPWRINYHFSHLDFLRVAIEEGSNVHGYFVWTLLDDLEWSSGYTVRFGIGYIDFKDNLKRHKKASHGWFRKFLNPHNILKDDLEEDLKEEL